MNLMNLIMTLVLVLRGGSAPPAPAPPASAPPAAPPAQRHPAPPTTAPTDKAPAAKDSKAASTDLNGLREWTVKDVKRTAIIHAPKTKPEGGAPMIFVFHGHGGSARNVERQFALHTLWPEAVVIYPQGLAAKTRLDPQGRRAGWQLGTGDGDDRDLEFFDAMLASLKSEGWVDPTQMYVTGHSNGGAFTYLLAAVRRDAFAAAAPSAAGTLNLNDVKPIPMMHLAGKKDQIVPYAGQERMMKFMRGVNKCADAGTEWAPGAKQYASEIDAPFVEYIHEGGHEFAREGPALIVKFFKEHKRKPATPAPPTPAKDAPKAPAGSATGTPKS